MQGFGFFDLAGEHPTYGTFYQQQTLWTEQWPGWTLPPEYQYNQGYILYQAAGQWRLTLTGEVDLELDAIVTPQAITGAVIPYTPPRRFDLAMENFNINKYSELRLIYGDYALGLWSKYIYLRQINPPDGNILRDEVVCKISASRKTTTSTVAKTASSRQAGPPLEPFEKVDCFNAQRRSELKHVSASARILGNYSLNRFDLLDSIYGGTGEVTLTSDYAKTLDYIGDPGGCTFSDIGKPFTPNPYVYGQEIESQEIANPTGNRGASFSMFLGSGPNPKKNFQEFFTATVGTITAAATTAGTKTVTTHVNPEFTDEYTLPVTGNTGISAETYPDFGDFCGVNLAVASYKKERVLASCVIYEHHTKTTYLNEEGDYTEDVLIHREITASHGRTKITKSGINFETGETTVTRNGVVSTIDDPTGAVYADILAEADDIEDFSSVALNEYRQYNVTKNSDTQTEQFGDD